MKYELSIMFQVFVPGNLKYTCVVEKEGIDDSVTGIQRNTLYNQIMEWGHKNLPGLQTLFIRWIKDVLSIFHWNFIVFVKIRFDEVIWGKFNPTPPLSVIVYSILLNY